MFYFQGPLLFISIDIIIIWGGGSGWICHFHTPPPSVILFSNRNNSFVTHRSTYLYDTLRPKLIHETNVDLLCELVDILKVEVLGEQLSRRSESLAGLRPTLQRILADVHERLTFRARTYIRDEVCFYIENFNIEAYPGCLFAY